MDNIIVITQNVKLESLNVLKRYIKSGSDTLVFSTQLIFENEATIIEENLDSKCTFKNFSDVLSDSDFQKCDEDAYNSTQKRVSDYYEHIKELKNRLAIKKLLEAYPCNNRIIVCDDLGLDSGAWIENGFRKVECEYYHINDNSLQKRNIVIRFCAKVLSVFRWMVHCLKLPIYSAQHDNEKYVFYGSLNRIAYRFALNFKKASYMESVKYAFFSTVGYFPASNTIRLSTLHEHSSFRFPDHKNVNLKLIQDGYLPPNYSSKYLLFNGKNLEYYTWDVEGGRTFEYHKLKHKVLPFRKKLYIPNPTFPTQIKKVLCVASGAGDWTAVKNRSDEDKMIAVFGKIAAKFPEIEFVYRCHPVWIHPLHQGVNSINRAAEYIHWLNLDNLKLSSNIPNANENGKFRLSYKRSSFEEDLQDVDIVFGEHSISMIDAAFKNILFCSVNVTGRRDFFCGITQMGFPHCESEGEISGVLKNAITEDFKQNYIQAVKKYNAMTDKEQ